MTSYICTDFRLRDHVMCTCIVTYQVSARCGLILSSCSVMDSPPPIPLDELFPFVEETQLVEQSSISQAQPHLTGLDELFPFV